jgi:hypothetical protein
MMSWRSHVTTRSIIVKTSLCGGIYFRPALFTDPLVPLSCELQALHFLDLPFSSMYVCLWPPEHVAIYGGQSKSSQNSLTSTVLYTMCSYRLYRVLLVIFTRKFCRGCAMQFGRSSLTVGRDSGICPRQRTEPTYRLLCNNSSQRITFLSSPTTVLSRSRSEWLSAVPFSENGPQWDTFLNQGRHQIEWDGRTQEDSKRSLPPLLPTKAGFREHVCARARGPYFEND